MQVVAELPRRFPEGSFLAQLKAKHPQEWEKRGEDPATLEAWVKKLSQTQSWIPLSCGPENQNDWISRQFSIVGADPGETNLRSLGFSGGQPMAIFIGHEFHKRTSSLDQSIDRLASRLCSPEERDLQAKRGLLEQAGHKLPMEELIRLRELARARWSDPRIIALRRKKRDYVRGEAHRLAAKAAKLASEAQAAIFVLSRNHGLKSASGRGSKQEPTFPTASWPSFCGTSSMGSASRWSRRRRASRARPALWTATLWASTPKEPNRRRPKPRGPPGSSPRNRRRLPPVPTSKRTGWRPRQKKRKRIRRSNPPRFSKAPRGRSGARIGIGWCGEGPSSPRRPKTANQSPTPIGEGRSTPTAKRPSMPFESSARGLAARPR